MGNFEDDNINDIKLKHKNYGDRKLELVRSEL